MIRAVEELSINAWPALQTLVYDGWILRFADGYTGRSNSVYPLYAGQYDLAQKVAHCEELYRGQGLKVAFKMTAASCPPELEAFLAARRYRAGAQTSVQLLELGDMPVPSPAPSGLSRAVSQEWFAAYCRMSRLAATHRATAWRSLRSIRLKAGFALLHAHGEAVACGLGVFQPGYLGLFDIVTDERYRRRGYGEQLVRGLLSWGKAQGAHTAFLQVVADNLPALGLYAKLGFHESYRYWYRVLERA